MNAHRLARLSRLATGAALVGAATIAGACGGHVYTNSPREGFGGGNPIDDAGADVVENRVVPTNGPNTTSDVKPTNDPSTGLIYTNSVRAEPRQPEAARDAGTPKLSAPDKRLRTNGPGPIDPGPVQPVLNSPPTGM